jgi:hypothetical protein
MPWPILTDPAGEGLLRQGRSLRLSIASAAEDTDQRSGSSDVLDALTCDVYRHDSAKARGPRVHDNFRACDMTRPSERTFLVSIPSRSIVIDTPIVEDFAVLADAENDPGGGPGSGRRVRASRASGLGTTNS